VTASPNGGASLVGSGSASTDGSGVATFSGLGLSGLVSGTYSVTFTSGTGNATSGAITLSAGAAAKLVMSAQPPSTVANGAAAVSAAVQVQDAAGNPLNVDGTPVSIALNGAGAVLSPTTPVNTVSGVATFSGLTITGLVGNYSLSFTSGSLTGVQSSPIALTPGAATQLAFSPAPPGAATSGNAMASHAVQLKDASGNNVPTAGVSVSAALSPAGASITAGGAANTDANGLATFTGLTLTLDVGTTPPYSGTLTYTAAGVAGTVQSGVTMASFFQLSVVTQPSGAKKDQVFQSQPVVQLMDAVGNPTSQANVTITASVFTGAGNLGGTLSVATNTFGKASFTNLAIDHTGSHQLRFGAGGVVAVSNPFVVNP